MLADPRAGTAAQALGIAERLGLPFRTVALEWGPFARLPIPWPSLAGLTREARAALWDAAREPALSRFWANLPEGVYPRAPSPVWPRLVLSAGRRSAPVARWLRRRGAVAVQCMRPGLGAADFDLLVIGRHDSPRPAPNVLEILGACHRLSPERLAAARAEWPDLAALPGPRVAVLVGGPVRGKGMPVGDAAQLIPRVAKRFPGATLLVTTSRRTGEAATAAIAQALRDLPHRLYRWGDPGPNPYAGFLAQADAIVVTGDSVSMLSEACATGAPVLVATREEGRHLRLVHSLREAGLAAPLTDAGRGAPHPPLDEAGRVAAEIRGRFAAAVGTS
ncbi:mitochondrial fission ELM1 family protein [Roseomonas sp. CCTCC AB2023176]|uniref:mitochondrial fission ELM1 family protein n=1 Tax=Roseomonas sp. CCTCC AB2023176 TaxID=3342640 RepID=UPI0035D913F9